MKVKKQSQKNVKNYRTYTGAAIKVLHYRPKKIDCDFRCQSFEILKSQHDGGLTKALP